MTKHCFGGGCSVGCDDRVDDGDGQDMFCFVTLKKDQGWSVDKGRLVITEDCLAHHMAVWRYLDDLGDDDDDNFGDMPSLMNIK